jgi:hypothetical protein
MCASRRFGTVPVLNRSTARAWRSSATFVCCQSISIHPLPGIVSGSILGRVETKTQMFPLIDSISPRNTHEPSEEIVLNCSSSASSGFSIVAISRLPSTSIFVYRSVGTPFRARCRSASKSRVHSAIARSPLLVRDLVDVAYINAKQNTPHTSAANTGNAEISTPPIIYLRQFIMFLFLDVLALGDGILHFRWERVFQRRKVADCRLP